MTPSPELVDEIAVRLELARVCDLTGCGRFIRDHRLPLSILEIEEIIRGRRRVDARICAALGYSKITRYMRSVSSPGACLPGVGNSPASVGAFSSS